METVTQSDNKGTQPDSHAARTGLQLPGPAEPPEELNRGVLMKCLEPNLSSCKVPPLVTYGCDC